MKNFIITVLAVAALAGAFLLGNGYGELLDARNRDERIRRETRQEIFDLRAKVYTPKTPRTPLVKGGRVWGEEVVGEPGSTVIHGWEPGR